MKLVGQLARDWKDVGLFISGGGTFPLFFYFHCGPLSLPSNEYQELPEAKSCWRMMLTTSPSCTEVKKTWKPCIDSL